MNFYETKCFSVLKWKLMEADLLYEKYIGTLYTGSFR